VKFPLHTDFWESFIPFVRQVTFRALNTNHFATAYNPPPRRPAESAVGNSETRSSAESICALVWVLSTESIHSSFKQTSIK